MITRRDVLRGVLAAPCLAAAGRGWARPSTSGSGRTVVVGAGLAGLAAANELVSAGREVLVVEASSRPGGRIRTLRNSFADGLEAEAGGDEIASSYDAVLSWVRKTGLSLVPGEGPAGRRNLDVLVDLGGDRARLSELRREPARWGPGFTDDERRAAPFGLLGLYLGPLAREMADPVHVLEPRWLAFDALTLDELLVDLGASGPARAMVDHVVNANDSKTVSALSVLRELARRFAGGRGSFHIRGGNDLLPRAMAARLGERVRYGVRLLAVEDYGAESVTLRLEQNGREFPLAADDVVITLPFTALRRVELDPPLPESRARAVAELPYTQVTKTYVQARRRFWRDDLGVSAVWSHGPGERVFGYRAAPEGPRGLLLSWINGRGTKAWQGRSEELGKEVLRQVSAFFPDQAELLESAEVVDWHDTYCQGAYAHFAPGQMSAWAADLARPIGNLHFAGEHTELVHPGMDGALRSGQRAAAEVLAHI